MAAGLGNSLLSRLSGVQPLGVTYDRQHIRVGPASADGGMGEHRHKRPREDGMLEDEQGRLIDTLKDADGNDIRTRAFDQFYMDEMQIRESLLDQNSDWHFLVLLAGKTGTTAYELLEENFVGRVSLIASETQEYLRQQRQRVLQDVGKRTQTLDALDTHIADIREQQAFIDKASGILADITRRWQPFADYYGYSPLNGMSLPYFTLVDVVRMYMLAGQQDAPAAKNSETCVNSLVQYLNDETRLDYIDVRAVPGTTPNNNPFPRLRNEFLVWLNTVGRLSSSAALRAMTSVYLSLRDIACVQWTHGKGESPTTRRTFPTLFHRLAKVRDTLLAAVSTDYIRTNAFLITDDKQRPGRVDAGLAVGALRELLNTQDTFGLDSLFYLDEWTRTLRDKARIDLVDKLKVLPDATIAYYDDADPVREQHQLKMTCSNPAIWPALFDASHLRANSFITTTTPQATTIVINYVNTAGTPISNVSLTFEPPLEIDAQNAFTTLLASTVPGGIGATGEALLRALFWMTWFVSPAEFWNKAAESVNPALATFSVIPTPPVSLPLWNGTYELLMDLIYIDPPVLQDFLYSVYRIVLPLASPQKPPLKAIDWPTTFDNPRYAGIKGEEAIRNALDRIPNFDSIDTIRDRCYNNITQPANMPPSGSTWSRVMAPLRTWTTKAKDPLTTWEGGLMGVGATSVTAPGIIPWPDDLSQWEWNPDVVKLVDFNLERNDMRRRTAPIWPQNFAPATANNGAFLYPWLLMVAFSYYYAPKKTLLLRADLDASLEARTAGLQELNVMAKGDYSGLTKNVMDVIHKMYVPSRTWDTQVLLTGRLRLKAEVLAALAHAHADIQQHLPQWSGVPCNLMTGNVGAADVPPGSVIPPELVIHFAALVAAYINKARLSFPVQYNKDKQYNLAPVEFQSTAAAMRQYDVSRPRGPGGPWVVTRRELPQRHTGMGLLEMAPAPKRFKRMPWRPW